LKQSLRVVMLLAMTIAGLAASSIFVQAQRIDLAFGINNTVAPSISGANGVDHLPVSLSGGVYPGFSTNVIF
jgi:hypothetical protein